MAKTREALYMLSRVKTVQIKVTALFSLTDSSMTRFTLVPKSTPLDDEKTFPILLLCLKVHAFFRNFDA